MEKPTLPLAGGCQCGGLRYDVAKPPLVLYCCHCTNCQRITGSAFALSALVIEASLRFTKGAPATTRWVSDAGVDRTGLFCPDCGTRLVHGQNPSPGILSLRAGALDDAALLRPAGHIWTRSAQPWVKFQPDDLLCEAQPEDYGPFMKRFQSFGLFTDPTSSQETGGPDNSAKA